MSKTTVLLALLLVCALVGCDTSPLSLGAGVDMAQPYVPTTDLAVNAGLTLLAGQPGGMGNLDGVGPNARFNSPTGVASDGAGAVYVSDGVSTIRKIELASGVVTTIAGAAGAVGSLDGVGAGARFYGPLDLVGDGVGHLYIADTGNGLIRKIDLATTKVTTFAGGLRSPGAPSADGTGIQALFVSPGAITVDGKGHLFVADYADHTIRQIDIATAQVTTVAGTSMTDGSDDGIGAAARFVRPLGIASDGNGQLYVADTGNKTLRKIDLASGAVSTLAGSVRQSGSIDGDVAVARFVQPFGVWSDGNGHLYVADNTFIRKIDLATATVSTIAGNALFGAADGVGLSARFDKLRAFASDGSGHLLVADSGNNVIRRIDLATATVSTIAGLAENTGAMDGVGSSARFFAPTGMATDVTGNLYVADRINATVRQIDSRSGRVTTLAGAVSAYGSNDGVGASARFGGAVAVASDGAGNLYLADPLNSTVRKIEIASSVVTTPFGMPGMAGGTDGVGRDARFAYPQDLVYDGGRLYVTDYQTVRQIDLATGSVTTLVGTKGIPGEADGIGAAASFGSLVGLATDGQGILYVADALANTVRKIEIATRSVTTVAGQPGSSGSTNGIGSAARFSSPMGLAIDGKGALYIADSGNGTIRKMVIATGEVSTVVGVANQIGVRLGAYPAGLACPSRLAMVGMDLAITDGCASGAVLLAVRP